MHGYSPMVHFTSRHDPIALIPSGSKSNEVHSQSEMVFRKVFIRNNDIILNCERLTRVISLFLVKFYLHCLLFFLPFSSLQLLLA